EHRVEPSEELAFGLQVLDDGLDDVVDVRECVECGSGRQPAESRVTIGRRQLALFHELFQRGFDRLPRAIQRPGKTVVQHDIEALRGEYLGDAVAHRARADDAYGLDIHVQV